MKKTSISLLLGAALLLNTANAAAFSMPPVATSDWATAEVQRIYENGLVSPEFDLGKDYTMPITRGQFARLAVDLVLAETGRSIPDIISAHGIILEAPILGDTKPSDEPASAPADQTTPDHAEQPKEGNEPVSDGAEQSDEPIPEQSDETTPDNAEQPKEQNEPVSDHAEQSDEQVPAAPDETTPDNAGQPEEKNEPISDSVKQLDQTQPYPGANPLDSGLSPVVNGSFQDTNSVYLEIAARLGIIAGADGLFRPNDKISRAEAASMLRRTAYVLGIADANTAPQYFADGYEIPRWAVENIKFVSGRTNAQGVPLMTGANGYFRPMDSFTIEQTLMTMGRIHATLGISDTYTGWQDTMAGYDLVNLALTFGGDCTFGRHRETSYSGSFDEMYDKHENDISYFFSGIPEFHNDDLTMVNFEGTLTNAVKYANKTFVFKGPAKYAEILPAGSIDVVTVANNHSMDYLQAGFDDTVRNLEPYVAVSGYNRMPVVDVKGVKIGFASNTGWAFDAAQKKFIENAITNLRAAGADIIVFNYHWGVERSYQSNPTQRAIGRYCIDMGADLVIGHHPHVVQEVENYKGKAIAYSLGNLVFGGNRNPQEKNCLIFRQNFTVNLNTKQITTSDYQALPYRVSSVNYRNDYHPVKTQ